MSVYLFYPSSTHPLFLFWKKLKLIGGFKPSKVSAMCIHCDRILGGYVLPHSDQKCPLRQALFCSECSVFGHLSNECPEKKGKRLLLPDSDSSIRSYLQTNAGISIKKGQSAKNILKQYTKEKGLRLVYSPKDVK